MSYLSDWAEQVIKRDRNCVICGSKQDLEAHHIFKVNNYDDAYLDLNNGIALCRKCHLNFHETYGLDCNIKNLLEFKENASNQSYSKLKKKYDIIYFQKTNLEKKYQSVNREIKKLQRKYSNVHFHMYNIEEKNKKLKKENKRLRKRLSQKS
ncbi:HNH endonuclease [bacterium]|nr:HNH endonuclease [bacterium]